MSQAAVRYEAMTADQSAYAAGYKAGRANRKCACPFGDGAAAWNWHCGYLAGQADR
jgi:ribosome modulation factor